MLSQKNRLNTLKNMGLNIPKGANRFEIKGLIDDYIQKQRIENQTQTQEYMKDRKIKQVQNSVRGDVKSAINTLNKKFFQKRGRKLAR